MEVAAGTIGLQSVTAAGVTLAILGYIVFSVVTGSKSLGSLIQLGELQRRQEVHDEIVADKPPPATRTARPPLGRQHSLTTTVITKLSSAGRKSFTVGVVNLCLTSYIIGAVPTLFYLWYTPKAIILIALRWLDFRRKKQHFLLVDFCYWANWLCLVYVWVLPKNATLFQIVFLCANGPLAWAVLAFNQSLVFHKWQQTVSVFIHVSPMLLTYGLRWFPHDGFAVCADPPGCDSVRAVDMLWNTMTRFYLFWVVGYYCFIFIYLGKYLESNSFKTLYDRVAGAQMKALFGEGAVFGAWHHLLKKAIYMGVHVLFGLFTMAAACIWWRYQWAHVLFIVTMVLASVYNASLHYADQFQVDREKEAGAKSASGSCDVAGSCAGATTAKKSS